MRPGVAPLLPSVARGSPLHQPERPCRELRCLRAKPAAGRDALRLPRRRREAQRLRALHAARVARGLDPRGPRRRDRALRLPQRPLAGAALAPARPARGDHARLGPRGRPPSRPGPEPPGARPRARAAARAAQRPRDPDEPRPEDGARARPLQRELAPAHRLGRRPLPRRPDRRGPAATDRGSVVTIVVGWELSWYRFEVDL